VDTALVAAVIAAVAAVFAAAMSLLAARQARRSNDRGHAWTRITWAAARIPSDAEYDISTTVLQKIAAVGWASRDDRDLAEDVLDARPQKTTPPPMLDDEEQP
jgi:hypothetical protein